MTLRIVWSDAQREAFFHKLLLSSKYSWTDLARQYHVHPRTLSDWRRGKSRLPASMYDRLRSDFRLSSSANPQYIDEQDHRIAASVLGGIARQQRYGNLGTREGRRRGGTHAIRVLSTQVNTNFKLAKKITLPRPSAQLAEFFGIVMGDGGISDTQVKIYGCISTDSEYRSYVMNVGHRLFGIKGSTFDRPLSDCWVVCFSSVKLVRFLLSRGLHRGNKIRQGLDVPAWIQRRQPWINACIRGLFDTDGCIYGDRHSIKGRTYLNLGLALTTASAPLLQSLRRLLLAQSFSPTLSGARNLLLRRSGDVDRFFTIIKPANEKHWSRYQEFVATRDQIQVARNLPQSQV